MYLLIQYIITKNANKHEQQMKSTVSTDKVLETEKFIASLFDIFVMIT